MNLITFLDSRDCLYYREGSGGTVEIFDVVVGSERRVGRGRQLVAELFRRLEPDGAFVWAFTRADNEIAHQWYRALGFREVARLVDFYGQSGTVDCLLFGRDSRGPL